MGKVIIEELAEYAHDAWVGWMQYLFDKSERNDDGTVTIPKWAVDRWERQSSTSYSDLPEDDKLSDRKEADSILKAISGSQDNGTVSDGYHTFDELYEFRKLYNAALFNEWATRGKFSVHKSKKHFDGEECFGGGWFIVVAALPSGQISNHYKLEDWDLFQIRETERALVKFDGHTAGDVANRLVSLCSDPGKLQESEDRMLKWFAFEHLPEHLQCASRPFHATAKHVVDNTAPGPERTVALRKLLEAKDAAVRAVLHPGG